MNRHIHTHSILTACVFSFNVNAQTTQEWQAKAVQKYPDLGVQGSNLNKQFLEAYNSRRKATPDFFNNSEWPLILADELVISSISKTTPSPLPLPDPTPQPEATKQTVSDTDLLAMQGIAKQVEDVMRIAKVTQTKAMVVRATEKTAASQ